MTGRGFGDEVFRLVRLGTAYLAGCGLYETVGNGLDRLFAPAVSDTVGFIVSFVGAYALVRLARRKLVATVAARFRGSAVALGGAVAGALRAGVVATTLMTALHISPVENRAADQSWIGQRVAVLQPDQPQDQEEVDEGTNEPE